MERQITHLDLDSFFVSVERLDNSSLIGKPVIIGGLSDRGVVSSCSYEARARGVHSAMPTRMAKQLCADGVFIRGDMEKYSRYSNMVTDVIAEHAPLYEKASIDEHYIDVSGMDRFYNTVQWTRELRARVINETGLPISFGLSVNKCVSKIATSESKPNGELIIPAPMVNQFLDPLSVAKIPMVGNKTFQLLSSMGVLTIHNLRQIPPEMLETVMGKNGIELWKRANGIDSSPVESYREAKSISTERTFENDTADIVFLQQTIVKMCEELGHDLRSNHKIAGCITVKIKYANFDTHTRQKNVAYTSMDHVIIDTAKELFKQLYERRMLIRLVGVRLSNLVRGTQPLDLFDLSVTNMTKLYQAMDKLKQRFGPYAVQRAVSKFL